MLHFAAFEMHFPLEEEKRTHRLPYIRCAFNTRAYPVTDKKTELA